MFGELPRMPMYGYMEVRTTPTDYIIRNKDTPCSIADAICGVDEICGNLQIYNMLYHNGNIDENMEQHLAAKMPHNTFVAMSTPASTPTAAPISPINELLPMPIPDIDSSLSYTCEDNIYKEESDEVILCSKCNLKSIMYASGATLCTACYSSKYGGLPVTDNGYLELNVRYTAYNYKRGKITHKAYYTLAVSLPYGNIYRISILRLERSITISRIVSYIYISSSGKYFCEYRIAKFNKIIDRCKADPSGSILQNKLHRRCAEFSKNVKIRGSHNRIYKVLNYSLPYES
jgi:hypothetical protein